MILFARKLILTIFAEIKSHIMNGTFKVKNVDLQLAKINLPQKFSTEEKVLAEIIRLSRSDRELNSIKLYHTLPDILIISKDAYRKAIAYLKKKGIIIKDGQKISFNKKFEFLSQITQITIKQS